MVIDPGLVALVPILVNNTEVESGLHMVRICLIENFLGGFLKKLNPKDFRKSASLDVKVKINN